MFQMALPALGALGGAGGAGAAAGGLGGLGGLLGKLGALGGAGMGAGGMGGLMTNPMFQAGMGILSENRKPFGGDPFMGAMGGLMSAREITQADEDRKRIQELREEIADLIRQQQGMAQVDPATGAISTPLPNPPPRQMTDLLGILMEQ